MQLAPQVEDRRRVEDGVVCDEDRRPLRVAGPHQLGPPQRGDVEVEHGGGVRGGQRGQSLRSLGRAPLREVDDGQR
jgi:hypothetical protein